MPYLPPCSALHLQTGIWICIPGSDEKEECSFCSLLIDLIASINLDMLIEYISIITFSCIMHVRFASEPEKIACKLGMSTWFSRKNYREWTFRGEPQGLGPVRLVTSAATLRCRSTLSAFPSRFAWLRPGHIAVTSETEPVIGLQRRSKEHTCRTQEFPLEPQA